MRPIGGARRLRRRAGATAVAISSAPRASSRRTRRVTTSAVRTRNSQLPAVACDRWNWVKPTV